MEQIDDSVYYDSNSEAHDNDEEDDNTFQDAIQVEDAIDDTKDDDAAIYGETINNDSIVPVGTEYRATGVQSNMKEYCMHNIVIMVNYTTNHSKSMEIILPRPKRLQI